MKKSKFGKDSPSELFWVDGRSACLEQLRQNKSQIKHFVFRDQKSEQSFIREATASGLWSSAFAITTDSESRDSVKCQVQIKPIDFEDYLTTLTEQPPVLLALDHVTDPRNLGAIIRSAAFFGVPAVIVAKDRQAQITQAAVSTAQGGFAACRLVTCTNLARALTELKADHAYWVAALDAGGEVLRKGGIDFDKLVLVLGAEGAGLSANIRKKSDLIVSIPGGNSGFDSLNVSVAAGIALFAVTR